MKSYELYVKNHKGQEAALVTYQEQTGIILKIETYSELIEDWVEMATPEPMPKAIKYLIKVCQDKVDQEISGAIDPDSFWFSNERTEKASGE